MQIQALLIPISVPLAPQTGSHFPAAQLAPQPKRPACQASSSSQRRPFAHPAQMASFALEAQLIFLPAIPRPSPTPTRLTASPWAARQAAVRAGSSATAIASCAPRTPSALLALRHRHLAQRDSSRDCQAPPRLPCAWRLVQPERAWPSSALPPHATLALPDLQVCVASTLSAYLAPMAPTRHPQALAPARSAGRAVPRLLVQHRASSARKASHRSRAPHRARLALPGHTDPFKGRPSALAAARAHGQPQAHRRAQSAPLAHMAHPAAPHQMPPARSAQ
jgi:hypothetical protein